MSELVSVLTVALEEDLSSQLASGETSFDQFLTDQGFSAHSIEAALCSLTLDQITIDDELRYALEDYRLLLGSKTATSGLLTYLHSTTGDDATLSVAGGLGRINSTIQPSELRGGLSLHERAEARAEQYLTDERIVSGPSFQRRYDRPSVQPSKLGQNLSLHEKAVKQAEQTVTERRELSGQSRIRPDQQSPQNIDRIRDYTKLYSAGRKELGNITWKTILIGIDKHIINYQLTRFKDGYISHLDSSNRHDSAQHLTKIYSDGNMYDRWQFQYKGGITDLTIGHFNNTGEDYLWDNTPVAQYHDPVFIKDPLDGFFINVTRITGNNVHENISVDTYGNTIPRDGTTGNSVQVTASTSDMHHGNNNSQYSWEFQMGTIWKKTKAYKIDQAIVQGHQEGTLVPENVKTRFGRLLAYSAIAYNLKNRAAIERNLWPTAYADIANADIVNAARTNTLKSDYQPFKQNTAKQFFKQWSHNQKDDAILLRMSYGVEVAANTTEHYAIVNAKRVYTRSLSDNLSQKQAERLANLTYFSDIALFDSFIASADLASVASSRLNRLTGEQALSDMTYALMPFIIRRQIHDTHHLLNLEKENNHVPKIANRLLKFDLRKNRILTKQLRKSDATYSNYLGFHPVHRTLRWTKHTVQDITKWTDIVFDHIIGWDSRLFTFGLWGGSQLQKTFNWTTNAAEAVTFSVVKGIVHLPKHIYKDTKTLCHQLGQLFTSPTWKGTWDALGRDTKGPRKMIKFAFKSDPFVWAVYHSMGWKDKVFWKKDADLYNTLSLVVKISGAKFTLKADKSINKTELNIHSTLHRFDPNRFQTSSQLFMSNHALFATKLLSHKTYFTNANEILDKMVTKDLNQDISQFVRHFLVSFNSLESIKSSDPILYQVLVHRQKRTALKSIHKFPSQLSAQISAQMQTLISQKLSSYDPKKTLSQYLLNHSRKLSRDFKTITKNQRSRFKKQLLLFNSLYRFAIANTRAINRMARLQNGFKRCTQAIHSTLSTQIKADWNSGGKKEFHRLFVTPIFYSMPVKGKWTRTTQSEVNAINKFLGRYQPGERLFADILLGDLVSSILSNKSVVCMAKRASAELNQSSYGKAALDLINWDIKGATSRMKFILQVGSYNVSRQSIRNLPTYLLDKVRNAKDFWMKHPLSDDSSYISDDLNWYHNGREDGRFLKQWSKQISRDASRGESVAVAWQSDIKTIKSGQTITVGELLNSLKPSNEQWGLHPLQPSNNQPTQPTTKKHTQSPNNSNPKDPDGKPVSVSLLGYKGRLKAARRIKERVFKKKDDPAKNEDPAKNAKEEILDGDTNDSNLVDNSPGSEAKTLSRELDPAKAVKKEADEEIQTLDSDVQSDIEQGLETEEKTLVEDSADMVSQEVETMVETEVETTSEISADIVDAALL